MLLTLSTGVTQRRRSDTFGEAVLPLSALSCSDLVCVGAGRRPGLLPASRSPSSRGSPTDLARVHWTGPNLQGGSLHPSRMSTLSWVLLVLVGGFVALNVTVQVVARRRAAKLRGQPLPALPGTTGERIAASGRALVYFFTPTCAACRPLTPRMKALAAGGQPVFPIDAMQEPELARAFSVMATPTTVEIQDGRVTGVSIGPVEPAVWTRFAEP